MLEIRDYARQICDSFTLLKHPENENVVIGWSLDPLGSLPGWIRSLRARVVYQASDDPLLFQTVYYWCQIFSHCPGYRDAANQISWYDPLLSSETAIVWIQHDTYRRAKYLKYFVTEYGLCEGIDILKGAYLMWSKDVAREILRILDEHQEEQNAYQTGQSDYSQP